MTPAEITRHLEAFREKQNRVASEEKARLEREEAVFRAHCEECQKTLETVVAPLISALSDLLAGYGHESVIHPIQETEHTTERTKLRSVEFTTAIAVQRPKGTLILRIVASPQPLQISSLIGVPHGNCSSVVYAGSGPLTEAEDVTNRGIADFVISAFPLR